MTISQNIAKHLREVYFGGNWCCSSIKEHIADVTWQQATTKVHDFNTIATLLHHMNYYVNRVAPVFEGGDLIAKDADSFAHPPIHSESDWNQFLDNIWKDAEVFAAGIEKLDDSKLNEIFVAEKYGTYYRNLHGIIEHLHYHLGQIVLVKKLLDINA